MGITKDGYDREEHDGNANAKNISIVKSTATIYAVVNTGAAGALANVTVEQGTSPWVSSFSGNVTLDVGSLTGIKGNLTIDQVDVVTAVTDITNPVALKGNVTLSDPKSGIGLVSIFGGSINAVQSGAWSLTGNVTIEDGGESITVDGTVAATQSGAWGLTGNVTVDQVDVVTAVTSITNPVALKGNVTLSNSKTFIGLATVVQSSAVRSILGNITVDQVDVVTAVTDITNPVALKGNITVEQVDLVTAVTDITNPVALKGNVTIQNTSIDGPGAPVIDSNTQAAFNLTAGADQVLVASSANKQIWVYGIGFVLSAAGTVSFQDEDNAAITGIMPFGANSGMAIAPSGNFALPLWKLGTDKDFEVDLVTAEMDGWVTYAIVSV